MKIRYKLFSYLLMSLSALFIWSSCANDMNSKFNAPKNAFGKANKLCVVADNSLWEGPIGDSIRYTFGAAYPILPQPEPTFDILHFTPEELAADPYRKELRAYLFVANTADATSATTQLIIDDLGRENLAKVGDKKNYNIKVGRDKWARGQILIYLSASSEDALRKAIRANYPAMAQKFHEIDEEQFEATIYFAGRDKSIESIIQDKFDLDIHIPKDYFIAVNEDSTLWLRYETEYLSSNLFFKKIPYQSKDQISKAYIKELRNELGKEYVSTEIEDTYMHINDVDLPMLAENTDINGAFALEARGIWEIVNDFMGGPFISYLMVNENKNELIFIDGFVHAPSKNKRDFMMHLEYIIRSGKFTHLN